MKERGGEPLIASKEVTDVVREDITTPLILRYERLLSIGLLLFTL